MRTLSTSIDADAGYLPNLDALTEHLRKRPDVVFVEVNKGGLNVMTVGGNSFRFIHHLENDSLIWTCYAE